MINFFFCYYMAQINAPLVEEKFYILPDYIKEQESLMRTKLNYLTSVLANKHLNGLPPDKQHEFEEEHLRPCQIRFSC